VDNEYISMGLKIPCAPAAVSADFGLLGAKRKKTDSISEKFITLCGIIGVL